MQELDDSALLRQYTESHSEEAFAALVARHINKVYSVALRHTRNPHQAEEITQAVFVILAGKAGSLGKGVILSGWLYQTARLASVTFLRSEIRRARREQEAHMQRVQDEPTTYETWWQIAPLLDVAMAKLSEKDRHAVVLRFFDGKSMSEVGAALGATEDAAKKRVNRALEKLQRFFAKRGVSSTTAVIAGALSANSVQAAPAALAKSVTAVAMAKGATASVSTLTLIKGALKVMAWTKAKTAVVAGVVLLLAAGTTTVAVKEISYHRTENIFDRFHHRNLISFQMLDTAPSLVAIQPANGPWDGPGMSGNGKLLGLGQGMQQMLGAAYGINESRIAVETTLPQDRYDYISTVPDGQEALRREITKKFGLVGRRETRDTDVFVLKVRSRSAPGLRPGSQMGSTMNWDPNGIHGSGQPMEAIANILEDNLKTPVIDQTGLTGNFNFVLNWKNPGNPRQPVDQDAFRQAVLNQLGLELVPSNMPVEMLVVEKAQ